MKKYFEIRVIKNQDFDKPIMKMQVKGIKTALTIAKKYERKQNLIQIYRLVGGVAYYVGYRWDKLTGYNWNLEGLPAPPKNIEHSKKWIREHRN